MKELLTRTECTAMRGIAILGIMLHNYCHWLKDIVRENEYTWTASKTDQFWATLQHPDELLPVQLFSFFGHYGVPVFLFLSGFGLVLKYESHKGSDTLCGFWRFLRYNYLKLFRMLIVGFAVFTMVDAITPNMHRYELIDVLGMLGMFANLLEHPAQTIWPGPYWYFGLTLQLYIVYWLLIRRWRHWGVVVAAIAVCWLWQAGLADDAETLERVRYNFIGGMLPFGLGVLLGRWQQSLGDSGLLSKPVPVVLTASVLLLSIVLIFAMSFSFQAWLWIPALIVVGTIALVKLLPEAILCRMVWLGGISAAIFVSHPIVRKVFVRPYWREDVYAGLLLYVVGSLVVAWLFMQVINKMPKPKL